MMSEKTAIDKVAAGGATGIHPAAAGIADYPAETDDEPEKEVAFTLLLGDLNGEASSSGGVSLPEGSMGDFNVRRNNAYTVTTNIAGVDNTLDHRIDVVPFTILANSAMVIPGERAFFDINIEKRNWVVHNIDNLGFCNARLPPLLYSDPVLV